MQRVTGFTLALGYIIVGCGPAMSEDLPPPIQRLIQRYESGAEIEPAGSMWKFQYRGADAFYVPVPMICCDFASRLYDREGNLICAPSGGITGAGDGGCPDFFEVRTGGVEVWSNSRDKTSR